ncbi:hypothetical protein D3H34_27720 [Acidovorax cavernicola]|uniref:Uncharacterized protein n=1 Tax=Acidovorax cavernicola TaxID=1675792 RepID=A0A9X8GSL4_9BURK|nr:hypothetical protein D3H34_27720 [Acidovorax cavernicola]
MRESLSGCLSTGTLAATEFMYAVLLLVPREQQMLLRWLRQARASPIQNRKGLTTVLAPTGN